MRKHRLNVVSSILVLAFILSSGAPGMFVGVTQGATQAAAKPPASAPARGKGFATPKQAAEELIKAAENQDLAALKEILGPDGHDIVVTGEPARDKEMATTFATKAREKMDVSVSTRTKTRATLSVGKDDWPFPVPIVKVGSKWFFDTKAGRQELLYRRIGNNEIDAIDICHGYVEAQHEFALMKREGYGVNEYAQRIISTEGKQDGLVWRNSDGTLGGPISEEIGKAIDQGYTRTDPYHGYYFKVLKGQGPAAPLGQMDFVVKGVMIGGFALIATPAQYRVSGVKTFIVSHDGVVYEKDLGPKTLEMAKKIEVFNPDRTWRPVEDQ